MKKGLLFTLIILAFLPWTKAQEKGTTTHSPIYLPQLKAELPKEVSETSGLFFHNVRLWTHNDSGGKPILFALDTTDFQVVQKVTLSNVKNKDWEDVCTDGETVFIGDFGNNKGNRKDLRIYTFPLSSIPACEAVFATEDYLYLLSKGWETGTTRLYRLSKNGREQVAEVVNGFDSQGLITGADYDREKHILAIVGYVKDIWKPFMYLIFDFEEDGTKLSNRRFEMPQLSGTQTEGICFFDDGRCYVSAETSPTVTTRVFVADFRKWIEKELKNKEK